jgi:thioredoxin 1
MIRKVAMTTANKPNTQAEEVLHIDDASFEKVLQSAGDKPVMVDFYADWCAPCQQAAPTIKKLAAEYAGKVIVAKLNTDESRETPGKFGIMSIPTVIMFHNGKELMTPRRGIGNLGEPGYRQMIESALSAAGGAAATSAAA